MLGYVFAPRPSISSKRSGITNLAFIDASDVPQACPQQSLWYEVDETVGLASDLRLVGTMTLIKKTHSQIL